MFKKIFRIDIGGKAYKITVEEIEDLEGIAGIEEIEEIKNVNNNNITKHNNFSHHYENWISDNNKTIKAPMAGIIVDIAVEIESEVKVGDLVVVLEAMKMENELRSHRNGKVKEVRVSQGQLVNQGDIIIILE